MCPHCRQNAPLIYRGANAFCTACGAPRGVWTNTSVNLAGQPAKVGGQVTRVFGWIVLVLGTLAAAGTLAACGAIVGFASAAPYVFAVPLALVAWVVSYFLFRGGKSLEKSGEERQKATRMQAVSALANTRGGIVTPVDLARAIGVTEKEADQILTTMAKESPEHVSIEVDDNGGIFYRFAAAHWASFGGRSTGTMTPNAVPHWRVPSPSRVADAASANVRVEANEFPGEPLEEEFEAELPKPAPRAR